MAWNNNKPLCTMGGIYSTAEAARHLGITTNTLRKYRSNGIIVSNPRSQYKGSEIIRLWTKHYNGEV